MAPPLRRRLAAAPLLALAALGTACVQDVHRIGPIAPRPPPYEPDVRALVFGDFGYPTIPQRLVARAMRHETAARPFDLAVEVGDNIYMCGPDPTRRGADSCRFSADDATILPGAAPPDDPLFRTNERPLEGLVGRGGAPLPVFLALGNHDVATAGHCAANGLSPDESARRKACLAVARRTAAWTMPGRHYVLDRGPVRFVVVDTNVVIGDYAGFTLEDEIAFVREATAPCGEGGDRQCFLVGHHPPAAVHGYGRGRPPAYSERMTRLVAAARGRARAFLAGHVHSLEHLSVGGLEVFISGSTAMGGFGRFRYQWPAAAQARFVTASWGYAVLEAGAAGYRVRFADASGDPLHCCVAERSGPCRPVDCE